MNYIQSLFDTIINSFDLKGRSSVQEYWRAFTIYLIFLILINISFASIGENNISNINLLDTLSKLIQFLISIPLFGLGVRRLHDTNKSGWWTLISITVIGLIPLLYWTLKKSDQVENKYGAVPEDANAGNFHRNIGISLNLIFVTLSIYNMYIVFSSMQEWQKEAVEDSGQEMQTIYRLITAKNKNNGEVFKFTLLCSKEKEMLAVISTFYMKENSQTPIQIIDSNDSISFHEKSDEINKSRNILNFQVIKDQTNTAFSEVNKTELVKLMKSELSLSVNTKEGNWGAIVNFNSPEVDKFINECSK